MTAQNPLGSLAEYSRFVAELLDRPTVLRSTLAVLSARRAATRFWDRLSWWRNLLSLWTPKSGSSCPDQSRLISLR